MLTVRNTKNFIFALIILVCTICVVGVLSASALQFDVADVSDFALPASGVDITAVQFNNSEASGHFSEGETHNLSSEGFFVSTGSKEAFDLPDDDLASEDRGQDGDDRLDQLPEVGQTRDASFFKVDFTVHDGFTMNLSFNQIILTEEGNFSGFATWWEQGYNDPYAFFVDGEMVDYGVLDGTLLEVQTGPFDDQMPEEEFSFQFTAGSHSLEWLIADATQHSYPDWALDSVIIVSDIEMTTARYMAAVPEPASVLLLGVGLLGFVGLNRRRHFNK